MSGQPNRDDGEVVVVGAGPAGSTCAIRLAELGHQVTIVDQSTFPRDKPCGDGLTRSAVDGLAELGLGQLVRDHLEVVGARLVLEHGRGMARRYERDPGQIATGTCVPRSVLDHALLTEALRRGARFVQGRVEAPVTVDGRVCGVRYTAAGLSHELRARHVVAADGATSRLRRAVFGDRVAPRGPAYAARAYFETEQRLDPLFDLYVPLELHGRRLPGYAWVFPLGEHRANIGVGFFGDTGRGDRVSIRRLFEATVDHLRVAQRRRFGDLEQVSPLFGSPLAVRFVSTQCDCEGMTFAGDAANTVDPVSGEGIAYALRGARIVAEAVHDRLVRRVPGPDLGARFQRRFPRLGQDPWRWSMAGASAIQGGGLAAALEEPFLATMVRVGAKTEADPSIRHTLVWQLAERHGAEHVAALERLDEALLAKTVTSTPLLGEVVHREIRAHGGPVGAATVLFSLLAAGGRVSDAAVDFASAVALTGIVAGIVVQLSDRKGDDATASVNDRLVVMATDFAHSRAAVAAAAAGPELLAIFGRGTRAACEGQMLQREGRGRLDRRHAERMAATAGVVFAMAAGSGAILAGRPDVQRQLERFGQHFGCAWQVADQLAGLVAGERVVGRDPGALARRGFHCVSVIEAAQRVERPQDADGLVEAARADEQALSAAADVVERHGADALETLSAIGLPDPAPLASLVQDTIARSRDLAGPSRRLASAGHPGQ